MAVEVFDWAQRLPEIRRGSNTDTRREILATVSSSRTLSDATLCTEEKKPFDALAERPLSDDG